MSKVIQCFICSRVKAQDELMILKYANGNKTLRPEVNIDFLNGSSEINVYHIERYTIHQNGSSFHS